MFYILSYNIFLGTFALLVGSEIRCESFNSYIVLTGEQCSVLVQFTIFSILKLIVYSKQAIAITRYSIYSTTVLLPVG